MVVLLREGFHNSKWTDQEIGYAMGRQLLIIAVRLGEDPYGFIGRFQAISGSTLPSGVLAGRIFDLLRKNKRTRTYSTWTCLKLYCVRFICSGKGSKHSAG